MASGSSRTETNTPQLQQLAPTHGELYALPKVSQQLLEDAFFDIGGWLLDNVADEFASQEGTSFVTGNGTNKPTGFLNGTPVSTGDDDSPARAAQLILKPLNRWSARALDVSAASYGVGLENMASHRFPRGSTRRPATKTHQRIDQHLGPGAVNLGEPGPFGRDG